MKTPRTLGTIAGLLAVAATCAGRDGRRRPRAPRRRPSETASRTCSRSAGGQDPQTLNPFVALDEEAYTVWAINWDLLVNFSPEDLSPTAGIAESWEVSDDEKTVTFTLADRTWSDGEPSPPTDVKYSLEMLGAEGDLFTQLHEQRHLDRDPRRQDRRDQDQAARRAHRRRPLHLHPPRAHLGRGAARRGDRRTYQPELPLVGSGPFIVTEFERGRILRMERNPEWDGRRARVRRDPVHQVRQRGRGRARPAAGRDRHGPRGPAGDVRADRRGAEHRDRSQRLAVLHRARVQPVLGGELPRRGVQPRGPGQDGAPGDRLRDRPRRASTRSPSLGTSFVANGILPSYYESLLRGARADLRPGRRRAGEPDARRRGLAGQRRRARGPRAT